MGNFNVLEAIRPTSIGGEYPQRLEIVIAVYGASALGAFLGPDLAEDPAIDLLSHRLAVVSRRDRSSRAVNDIAAHLHRGQPAEYLAFSRADRRRLSFDYPHETCHGPQICGDGDCLMRGDQFVELERGASFRPGSCGAHVEDVAYNLTPCPYPHAWRQRNVLHNPARNHLARFAFGVRNGLVQTVRQYGSGRNGNIAFGGALLIGRLGMDRCERPDKWGTRSLAWTSLLRIDRLLEKGCAQQRPQKQACRPLKNVSGRSLFHIQSVLRRGRLCQPEILYQALAEACGSRTHHPAREGPDQWL